ncbi:MAG: prepilin-type N-terminal cleavage/methylation domain-containing protein [Planctomycetes bacterium]|nr:prepilin-type N-terminal cleavage/methylation domain-containing protein [Planctomycetota bacterium]
MKNRRNGRKKGFTLVELLIALGIMASCLSISLGLFAAAIYENNNSFKLVLGRIITQTGLAISEQTFKASNFQTQDAGNYALATASPSQLVEVPNTVVSANSKVYGAAGSGDGFKLLARRVAGDAWLLVVTAYRQLDPSQTVTLQEVQNLSVGWNPDSNAYDPTWIYLPSGDTGHLRYGSPVLVKRLVSIDQAGASVLKYRPYTGAPALTDFANIQAGLAEALPGAWANIIETSSDGKKGRLDTALAPWYYGRVVVDAYILQEGSQLRLSPAVGTASMRTYPRK